MAERQCAALAESQSGVFAASDAGFHELKRHQMQRRVRAGRWHRELPSVYRFAGAPQTWEGALRASVLWAEKQTRLIPHPARIFVSHGSAARLWGFPRFERVDEVELTTKRAIRNARVTVHATKKKVLREWEVTWRSGFAVTTPARTLLDLANRLSFRELATCVDHCLRTKLTSVRDLERTVIAARGRRGVRKLRALVQARAGGRGIPDSVLEEKALRLLEDYQLPAPVVQRRVDTETRRARVDLLFERQGVVVECDGYAWHSDIKSFEVDRVRQNALAACGLYLLRWTWAAMRDRPHELAMELAKILRARTH